MCYLKRYQMQTDLFRAKIFSSKGKRLRRKTYQYCKAIGFLKFASYRRIISWLAKFFRQHFNIGLQLGRNIQTVKKEIMKDPSHLLEISIFFFGHTVDLRRHLYVPQMYPSVNMYLYTSDENLQHDKFLLKIHKVLFIL